MTTTGRCLCRATTFAFDGKPAWAGHCHCESCRRNCSAAIVSFLGVARSAFRWTGQETGRYASSPGVIRHFCRSCGSPMAYDAAGDRANIHLYAASLDDPSDYHPTFHVFHAEALPWLHLGDELKKFPGSGGSDV
jgi:hypothetical protein